MQCATATCRARQDHLPPSYSHAPPTSLPLPCPSPQSVPKPRNGRPPRHSIGGRQPYATGRRPLGQVRRHLGPLECHWGQMGRHVRESGQWNISLTALPLAAVMARQHSPACIIRLSTHLPPPAFYHMPTPVHTCPRVSSRPSATCSTKGTRSAVPPYPQAAPLAPRNLPPLPLPPPPPALPLSLPRPRTCRAVTAVTAVTAAGPDLTAGHRVLARGRGMGWARRWAGVAAVGLKAAAGAKPWAGSRPFRRLGWVTLRGGPRPEEWGAAWGAVREAVAMQRARR